MKMIAIGTIHGRKLIRAADPKNSKSKAKYADLIAKPGEEFDTDDFGIDDDEARSLIAQKSAKRKTREVVDDGKNGNAGADDLDTITDAELVERAKDRGVTIKPGASRAELVASLREQAA